MGPLPFGRLPIGIWQTGTNDVTTIATSHDGNCLATDAKDGTISLWSQLGPATGSFDTLTGNAVMAEKTLAASQWRSLSVQYQRHKAGPFAASSSR